MTNDLLIFGKNLRISSYNMKPFLIYDFAPDPMHLNFHIYEEIFFISVPSPIPNLSMTVPLRQSPHLLGANTPHKEPPNHAAVTCNGNHHDWFAKIILASGRASATKQPDFRLPGAVPPKHSRVFWASRRRGMSERGGHMDQISIKTPNPICRLY